MGPVGDSHWGMIEHRGASHGSGAKDGQQRWGRVEGTGRGPEIQWRRVPGVELLGAAPGTDPQERLFLVQRPDRQAVQLSELLYLIVAAASSGCTTEELTAEIGRISGRSLSTVALIHLIDKDLLPLGLIESTSSRGW